MKSFLAILFLIATSIQIISQKPILVCGYEHFIKIQKAHNPNYIENLDRMYEAAKTSNNNRGGGNYTLPVVFHVLHNSENQNIPDSVVYSQLEVLNEDYRRMNADAVNTRDIFLPVAADTDINFALATMDPDGNPTSGITHTYTDRESFEIDIFSQTMTLDEVKHAETGGSDAWDPEHYVNIWICNIDGGFLGQIFGYAYPPAGLDNWPEGSEAPDMSNEGIVLHYTVVGRNNPYADEDGTSENNLGRALVHEMGHYLGLRHIWGDELFTDICSEDDGIDDTPLCGGGDQFACDFEANTCDDGTENDQPDMLENYMDYTQDECYNMFTQGQKMMMHYVIDEIRFELLTNSVGIKNSIETNLTNVWPNPTNTRISFSLPSVYSQFTYAIRNILGEIVMRGQTSIQSLDVSKLSTGTYILSTQQNEVLNTSRFVVK
jgi:hypothetical protein